MALIKCPKCGENVSDQAVKCVHCGDTLIPQTERTGVHSSKKRKHVISVIVVLLCIGLVFTVYQRINIQRLEKQLERNWSRYEDMLQLHLDFDGEGEVEYYVTSWILGHVQIDTMKYKVLSGDTVQIMGRKIHVTFNEDKSMMIFEPAATSTDAREYWFN